MEQGGFESPTSWVRSGSRITSAPSLMPDSTGSRTYTVSVAPTVGSRCELTSEEKRTQMSEQEQKAERTLGGSFGKAVGRAKEAVGSVLGSDELSREGRMQTIQAEAEQEATEVGKEAAVEEERAETADERTENEVRRRQLETELADESQKEEIEARKDSALSEADRRVREEAVTAERQRRVQEATADAEERAAGTKEATRLSEASRLKMEAERAEKNAESVDPEGAN